MKTRILLIAAAALVFTAVAVVSCREHKKLNIDTVLDDVDEI